MIIPVAAAVKNILTTISMPPILLIPLKELSEND
jgi:hypothetical protein